MESGPSTSRLPYWLPGAVLAVAGLVFAGFLYVEQDRRLTAIEQARFEQHAAEVSVALRERLAGYTEVVFGLRGLFIANPQLTRTQFQRAADELDAASRTPGLVNLAFTRRVAAGDLPAFEQRTRNDPALQAAGIAGFGVHPQAERDEYFVADYLWPLTGNEQILGLDIGSQPANLLAMQRARSTGAVVVTKPFELVQAVEPQQGFVIRVPVFDAPGEGGRPPAPEHFLGAVAATVNVSALMRHVQGVGESLLAVELADLGTLGEDAGSQPAGVFYRSAAAAPLTHLRPAVHDIAVHNRRWQLAFEPTARFLSVQEIRLPANSAAAAAVVSLLLAAVLSLLMRQRRTALLRAYRADAARERSEGRFRALFNQAGVGVALADIETGRLSEVNPRFCSIVGQGENALRGQAQSALFLHPGSGAGSTNELHALRAPGATEMTQELALAPPAGPAIPARGTPPAQRWVARTVCAMRSDDGPATHAIVVLHDITARRAMEDALRRSESRLHALLHRLPVGVMLMERDGTTALCNQRFTEITGYRLGDVPTAEIWWRKAYPDAATRNQLQAEWFQDYRDAGKDGMLPEREVEIAGADGRPHTLEVAGVRVGPQLLVTFVDLSQRKAAEREIRTLAYYDLLTGLPNRRLLVMRVEQAAAQRPRGAFGALMMFDIDNFKVLNDTRGHERGDALLKLVAERLVACVRTDDTVARPGGDEFAVLLEDVGDSAEQAQRHCEQIGQKILAALRLPYLIDGEAHHCTLSMGIAVFTSGEHSVDELLQRVDLAMYQAKAAGRDTLRFYDPSMRAQASERAALEEDMRAGLAEGQFELYFQPQVDHGRIVGAEALLRWRHPVRGFVSPGVFIPLAEESGQILPLGQWVLEQACRTLAEWARDPRLAELTLAVNVSPRQFRQAGFVQQVLSTLASTGAAARRLKLELTEGLLLHDVSESATRMTELKSYGVGFSLDDFGTGYSSLAYLKRLPLDQLKIDQSFVRDVLTDPNDASIVRAIVTLGASLGLQVVAEGVETVEQQQFLAGQHCHAWQGFLLSPALPPGEFTALVARQPQT